MKFRKTKIAFLILEVVLILGSVAISYIFDPLKSTREELQRFYIKEFRNFSIGNIISLPYPGKGEYKLFNSAQQQEYYPIILEFGDEAQYDLFKVGTIIDKPAFSINVTLRNGEVTHQVKIRKPSDESSKGDFLFPVSFFGFILILCLILPNEFFENLIHFIFKDEESD